MLFLPNVDFGALPPEVNSARIQPTGGFMPMMAASGAISAMSGALNTMAAVSQGSMAEMGSSWRSRASEAAQERFGQHTGWFHQQAGVAAAAAPLVARLADAYFFALMTMPPLGVIVANRIAGMSLAVSNVAGQNTPAIAANEAAYYQMWIQAQAVMYKYAGEAISALGALPPPISPPPQIGGGLGTGPSPGAAGGDGATPTAGPVPEGATTVGAGPGGGTVGDPGTAGGADGVSGTGTDATNSATDLTQSSAPVAESSNVDPSSADPLSGGGTGDAAGSSGFFGTSSFSPTLAGLNGGLGSVVPLGMAFGGAGGVMTSANQFRMPASWAARPGATFGALPSEAAPAPVGRTAPSGASAPASRMRRDRREYDTEHSTVFVGSVPGEVPELSNAPAIGVIEYDSAEPAEDDGVEQVLVGVIDSGDDVGDGRT
ncbi:PPE family protein [Nocardia brasiliensis]|uniref:PPE family protein n=1 Tax=Nocardia brasiliensis TaxID=37326 RepID=UPI00378FD7F9